MHVWHGPKCASEKLLSKEYIARNLRCLFIKYVIFWWTNNCLQSTINSTKIMSKEVIHLKLSGNCAFSQNFHTRKFGDISLLHAVHVALVSLFLTLNKNFPTNFTIPTFSFPKEFFNYLWFFQHAFNFCATHRTVIDDVTWITKLW